MDFGFGGWYDEVGVEVFGGEYYLIFCYECCGYCSSWEGYYDY